MSEPSRAPTGHEAAGAPHRKVHRPERDQTQYLRNWIKPLGDESTDSAVGVTQAAFESFRIAWSAAHRALLSRCSRAARLLGETLDTRLLQGIARVATTKESGDERFDR